jgi:hypothetical protein
VDEEKGLTIASHFVDRSLATSEQQEQPERGIKLHDLQLDYVPANFQDQDALRSIHRGAAALVPCNRSKTGRVCFADGGTAAAGGIKRSSRAVHDGVFATCGAARHISRTLVMLNTWLRKANRCY